VSGLQGWRDRHSGTSGSSLSRATFRMTMRCR
jgi:hypothetical protein